MEQDNEYVDADAKVFAEEMHNNERLLKKLPAVQKKVANHYLMNIKYIRQTMIYVLDRELDTMESHRLRVHSFSLAVEQVAEEMRKKTGIPIKELKEMALCMSKSELLKIMKMSIDEEQEK
jgi:hypothetical protein